MEATAADSHHHHHHHDEVEVNPATWTDPKRYAWLLGIIVPMEPFLAWGSGALTGLGAVWLLGARLLLPRLLCSAGPMRRRRRLSDMRQPPRCRRRLPARQLPQVARPGPLL